MYVGHQTGRVAVNAAAIFKAGQHRHEIGLVLLCYAPLVSQLVGDGGGDGIQRGIHIDVGLRGEGEEKAGGFDIAHKPGEEHLLGAGIGCLQTGVELRRLMIEGLRPAEYIIQIHGVGSVFIPTDLIAVFIGQGRKVHGGIQQFIPGNSLSPQAALLLEGVGIIKNAPPKAE